MIESRLSSRYSYDFHPEFHFSSNKLNNSTPIYSPNESNFNYYNTSYHEPPKEEHYSFIDPWDEYLVSTKQKSDEIQEEIMYVNKVDSFRGDGNTVEVCFSNQCEHKMENNNFRNQCEQEMENNYYAYNCDMEEQTKEYSFQDNEIKKCNALENVEKNEHFGEVREFNIPKPNQETIIISNEIHPACSEDIPINLNSSLSVNNCLPDSPTHCEVPMDRTCDLNGGLAGQFARVSLGEKTTDQMAVEDFLRRQSWEHGNADYLGKDSFSNIWAKINETLSSTPEVKVEPSATKTSSSLEVVLSEEPKPLKSALKKTSTTIPPVESELQIDSNEPPVKQLEKLNLSKDDPNQKTTPDTPTVTSPTPPTTPASQAQESSKPESVKETPKPNVVEPVRETPKPETVEPIKETPKPEAVESVKETPKPETVESVKETPKPDVVESIKEIPKPKVAEPVKETQKPEAVESVKETPKPETAEPVKEIPKTATAEPAKEIPKTETVAPVKEIPKTETVAPLKETPKPDVIESVKETPKTVESVIETQKPESVKEKPKPEVTKSAEAVSTTPAKTPEPVKQTPKADESKKESLASVKLEEVSSISVSSVPKSDEPAKEVSKSAEVPQKPQPSVDDNSAPLESSDPPVAPKRTNKGSSNVPKPAQPSEKK